MVQMFGGARPWRSGLGRGPWRDRLVDAEREGSLLLRRFAGNQLHARLRQGRSDAEKWCTGADIATFMTLRRVSVSVLPV